MRQVFALSLAALLFTGLLMCPVPAGAGDPDIPQAGHKSSAVKSGSTVVMPGYAVKATGPGSVLVAKSPCPSGPVEHLLQVIASWMIARAAETAH